MSEAGEVRLSVTTCGTQPTRRHLAGALRHQISPSISSTIGKRTRAPLAPRKRACRRQSWTRAWPAPRGDSTAQSPAGQPWRPSASACARGKPRAERHASARAACCRRVRVRVPRTASLTMTEQSPLSALSRMLPGVRSAWGGGGGGEGAAAAARHAVARTTPGLALQWGPHARRVRSACQGATHSEWFLSRLVLSAPHLRG